MREILFRGKNRHGKWVQGWFCGKTLAPDFASTENLSQIIDFKTLYWHIVDPETVGQYTGLTDTNGKMIFEGDIIKHYNNTRYPEQFEIGMVWWDDCHLCFKRTSSPQSVYVWHRNTYEVIGNIHDNPELLEVDND